MDTGTRPAGAGAHGARAGASRVFRPDESVAAAVTFALPVLATAETATPLSLADLALPPPAFAAPAFVMGSVSPLTVAAATPAAGPRTDRDSDLAVRGTVAAAKYRVTGLHIKIGILSDSFDLLGGMAADIADGNLPAGVTILQEGPAGSHDEGRAMADLIHSIAPGAQILFHTATAGEADFAAGIKALQAAGCTVIVDDVAYLNEPFFQVGSAVQAAVQSAVAAGVSYFTAAGNAGDNFIQQDFAPMRAILPGLPRPAVVQNFDRGGAAQPWLDVTVPTGGELLLDLQWDQPFAGIGGSHGSANSLGMALYSPSGTLVAQAGGDCVGSNPDQVLSFTNTTGGTAFRLVLWLNGGSAPPDLFKIIDYGNGSLVGSGAGEGSGSVIGQQMVQGANTVGAVAWYDTPAFGGSDAVEPYSSLGTGDILFGANGQRLARPVLPGKVNFVAPDGSITSVLAPFDGTSAAAAVAAGVAALVQQADPWLTPAQLTEVLEATAVPAGGGSVAAGAGLIQADAAVAMALAMAHASGH